MNHCFEICHYQQNVPQHHYLLDTLVYILMDINRFVEHVNCSSHRSKKSKVSNEHRFITFSLAVQTAPIIRSKHSPVVRTVQGVPVGIV